MRVSLLTLVALVVVDVAWHQRAAVALVEPAGKRVRLAAGLVQGYTVDVGIHRAHVFKGIPFAKPPLGKLRFMAPEPPEPWTGVLDATRYSAPCMSNSTKTTSPQKFVSEDCLYVNVFADARCLSRACPTIFYIHGGGYFYDSAVMFNDTQIIEKYATKEMVFVIPAYRMGIYGFIDLGRPTADAPYNVGFLDQIAALEWLRAEGSAFGVDLSRITAMGNSGGGNSVLLLLGSPVVSRDYFAQAIISSGTPSLQPHISLKLSQLLANQTGCARYNTIEQQVECLRHVSAYELSAISAITEDIWGNVGPQTDDHVLPADDFEQLIRQYPLTARPLLITSTMDEWDHDVTNASITEDCHAKFSNFGYKAAETAAACANYYSKHDILQMDRDVFQSFVVKFAIEQTLAGGHSYVGIFGQKDHAGHADDMMYFFGLHLISNMTSDDLRMDVSYPRLIRNFVSGKRPFEDWEPATEHGRNYYWLAYETDDNNTLIDRPHLERNQIFNRPGATLWLQQLANVERAAQEAQKRATSVVKTPTNLLLAQPEQTEDEHIKSLVYTPPWILFWTLTWLATIFTSIALLLFILQLVVTYRQRRQWQFVVTPIDEHTKIFNKMTTTPYYS